MNTPQALGRSGSHKHAYGFAFHGIRNTLVARQLLTERTPGLWSESRLMDTDGAARAFPSRHYNTGSAFLIKNLIWIGVSNPPHNFLWSRAKGWSWTHNRYCPRKLRRSSGHSPLFERQRNWVIKTLAICQYFATREILGLVPVLSGSFSAGLDRGHKYWDPQRCPLKIQLSLSLSHTCV